jgi:hypothetical protein
MGKGQILLVYSGDDDQIFIGNPQTTFFKKGFRRHTNYSYEHITHTLRGSVKFGQTITFELTHVGDLLQNMYLHLILPSLEDDETEYNYTEATGHAIIENIRFMLGEQTFDQFNGEYMELYNELNQTFSKRTAMDLLLSKTGYYDDAIPNRGEQNLWIPLPFWFTRTPSSSLPISALGNSTIKVEIRLRKFTDVVSGEEILSCQKYPNKKITKCELVAKHYFLDTRERTTFISKPLEYCITQVQRFDNQNINNAGQADATQCTINPVKANVDIPFKCLLKELFWTVNTEANLDANKYFKYTNDNDVEIFRRGRIQINGEDIMNDMDKEYFTKIIPYELYSSVPHNRSFPIYTFCVDPIENNPTGHFNLFMAKSLTIQMETAETDTKQFVNVYGTCYNVIRIHDGYAQMYFVYV